MSDFKLLMGTNTIADSTGILTSNGTELIGIEVSPKGELLVNANIFDAQGHQVAKLNRSAWAFKLPGYEVKTQKGELVLTNPDGAVVLDVSAGKPGEATIRRASLHTPNGSLVLVTADELVLPGGNRFQGNTFRSTGTAFDIGD